MKVLHLPSSVGGNAWHLSQGENKKGIVSEVLVKENNWINYPNDINLQINKCSTIPGKLAKQLIYFFKIRNKYDVYHFNSGSSLLHFPSYRLNHLDIPYYPKNKRLFVTYNGCDARQKIPTCTRENMSACAEPDCYNTICMYGKLDKFRQAAIKKIGQYVRHMWALNPDLLYYLPKGKSSFLPYSVSVGASEIFPPKINRVIKIVHAPTNRVVKGTKYILDTLNRIEVERPGVIDVELVENVPHKQALEIYKQADIVIDQIKVGWYGAISVECMMMGKPVIAWINRDDLHFIPEKMRTDVCEAFIIADQYSLYEKLLEIIDNSEQLARYSEAAIEYANKWHRPEYVAGITKRAYEEF